MNAIIPSKTNVKVFFTSLLLLGTMAINNGCSKSEMDDPNPIGQDPDPDTGGDDGQDPDDGNDPSGTVDHQDVTVQTFSAVRIGASDPGEEDIMASSGARMPLSGSAFYNTQNQLNKTTFGLFGTVIGGANGVDIPGYGEATSKSYKSVNFYILSQEDIDNGIVPNGKLVKNVEIDVGQNIGSDGWGGSMSPLNAAGYTVKVTDGSDILGTTRDGEVVTETTYNDVTDAAITSQFAVEMDKFVTNIPDAVGGFTKAGILEALAENELNILIIESFTNINGTLQQKKLTN